MTVRPTGKTLNHELLHGMLGRPWHSTSQHVTNAGATEEHMTEDQAQDQGASTT